MRLCPRRLALAVRMWHALGRSCCATRAVVCRACSRLVGFAICAGPYVAVEKADAATCCPRHRWLGCCSCMPAFGPVDGGHCLCHARAIAFGRGREFAAKGGGICAGGNISCVGIPARGASCQARVPGSRRRPERSALELFGLWTTALARHRTVVSLAPMHAACHGKLVSARWSPGMPGARAIASFWGGWAGVGAGGGGGAWFSGRVGVANY